MRPRRRLAAGPHLLRERNGMARVDLNSDLGESFGRYTLGLDEQVIPLVTSVNVACGMRATLWSCVAP